jgi:hypothetical protein
MIQTPRINIKVLDMKTNFLIKSSSILFTFYSRLRINFPNILFWVLAFNRFQATIHRIDNIVYCSYYIIHIRLFLGSIWQAESGSMANQRILMLKVVKEIFMIDISNKIKGADLFLRPTQISIKRCDRLIALSPDGQNLSPHQSHVFASVIHYP